VVARIPLVRGEPEQVARRKRQVGIDRDPRPEAAEVVGVPEPALAGDDLELHLLALGQADGLARPLAHERERRVDRPLDRPGRHRSLLEPARVPCRQIPGADERLIVDPLAELRRAVVGVDELGLVPSEPQAELEVALGLRHAALRSDGTTSAVMSRRRRAGSPSTNAAQRRCPCE